MKNMILLISKDQKHVEKQIRILKSLNHIAIHVQSCGEASELCKSNPTIELAIIDIDSIENTSVSIQDILDFKDIPFIYLTSEIKASEIKTIQDNACYGYIPKDAGEFILGSSILNTLNLFKKVKDLKLNEKKYKKAELLSGFGHWELDLNKKIVYGSKGAEKIYGFECNSCQYTEIENMVLPEYKEMKRTALRNLIEKGLRYDIEFEIKNKRNENTLSIHSIAEFNPQKNIVSGSIYDISKQKSAEAIIKKSEENYKNMFQNHHSVILIIDPDTLEIMNANIAASKFYGWSQSELTKMKITDINMTRKEKVQKEILRAIKKEKTYFLFKHRVSNGEIKDIEAHTGPVIFNGKKYSFSVINDITERKKSKETIEHLAYYDTLTNFPNRKNFIETLEKLIFRASENNTKFSLLYIDLDNFKKINDDYGHITGDLFLRRMARRLKKSVGENSVISRIGGDEFTILLEGVSEVEELSIISNKILSNIRRPFQIKNKENFISASIGISIFPDDGTTIKKLLNNSDAAMYNTKNTGKDGFCFFSEEIDKTIKRKDKIKIELRKAIKNNKLELYYQPKIDVSKKEIIGAEALTRWISDGHSYLYPDEFIPIAEESKLIFELDK